MDRRTLESLRNRIAARAIHYYDMGVRDVLSINRRLAEDLGNNYWHELLASTRHEEEIIQNILTDAGRRDFVFHDNNVDTIIRRCWESGCHDVQQIAEQTNQYFQAQYDLTTHIDERIVRTVLTQTGCIV
jgi:hypothetical protein